MNQVVPAVRETAYDRKFYERIADGSLSSARAVVPIILSLTEPRSVVDVGCGVGSWLRAFEEHGLTDYLGLDGAHVDRDQLLVSPDRFRAFELCDIPSAGLGQTFDLALCLEVAEHLPSRMAERLVAFLADLAPCVLFSAAMPGQGGTNHVNERWPGYWRRLFESRGYDRLDPIRPRVWRDPRVEWWYKQNLFLYCRRDRVAASEELTKERELSDACPFELVSGDVFGPLTTVRGSLWNFLRVARGAIRRLLTRGL